MALLLWLLVGVVLGAVAERLLPRRAPDGAAFDGAVPPQPTDHPKKRRNRKRIAAYISVGIIGLLLVVLIGGYFWARSVFDKIEKVDVTSALTDSSHGTNYLLVGSDNGEAGGEQREGVQGSRSDTIMVLHVEGGGAKMLSLNRDLLVTNPATGDQGKLNATYNQGPTNLINAVTQNFGIPIDRYIEIDFISFGSLVDSFGGIDVDFANPAFDLASGLDVKQAGRVHLDGPQALAYVRSRHYYEMIDGQPKAEGGLPDVNRTQRQQTFLRAIMAKAGHNRNPFTLMSTADKMSDGLRIDDDMTMWDAARFGWQMGRLDPETVKLPVVPRTTSSGAAVLDLGPGAEEVLDQFR